MADTVEDFERVKQEFVGLRARLLTLTGNCPSALEPPTARHYETLNPDVQQVLMEQVRSANAIMRERLAAMTQAEGDHGDESAIGGKGPGALVVAVLVLVGIAATLLLALLS